MHSSVLAAAARDNTGHRSADRADPIEARAAARCACDRFAESVFSFLLGRRPHRARQRAHRLHGRSSSTSGSCGRCKALAARRYRPFAGDARPADRDRARARLPRARGGLPARAGERARPSAPDELIAIVDGGDAAVAAVAADYCDRVLRIPKAGKRAAIAAGLAASDPVDRRRRRARLRHGLGARRAGRDAAAVRRSARRRRHAAPGDLRRRRRPRPPARRLDRGPALPADGAGAVRVRAGRLPRGAHDRLPARRRSSRPSTALVRQTVFGVPAARRRRPRADERAAARRLADRLPVDRAGVRPTRRRTGARSGASSCAGGARASARRCSACAGCGGGRSRSRRSRPTSSRRSRSTRSSRSASRTRSAGGGAGTGAAGRRPSSRSATSGCWSSIGVRQIPHLRRRPRDLLRLPLFVLQLTFVMVPIRILAFATMLHQSWSTAPGRAAVRAAQ